MNTKPLLLAISAAALLHSGFAYAETKSANEIRAEESTTGNMKEDAKKAWKDVKHDAKEAAAEIKAFFVSEDETVPAKETSYAHVSAASNILGAEIVNYKNDKIGKVKDIIVDGTGHPQMVIVADNDIPGFDGKLVAFDYTSAFTPNAEGDVLSSISEENLKNAKEFSYDSDDKDDVNDPKIITLPAGSYSVEKLLGADVYNAAGEKVGDVDNIYFKGGTASLVIIDFDTVMGMGGDKVAVDYAPLKLNNQDDKLTYSLSDKQSASFEAYKKSVKK